MQLSALFVLKPGWISRGGLVGGPLLFSIIFFGLTIDSAPPAAGAVAAIACWMAVWWMTEAVPLAATSLLPLLLFPLTGAGSTQAIAPEYANSTIFLFVGGILIALAMERWRLHRRIALFLIGLFGSRPAGLLAGFMTASAFISCWISNTATAVMMLPIGMAIIRKLEHSLPEKEIAPLRLCILLGIAYSCSIGGMTTPIGTPPNMVFLKIYEIQFPAAPKVSFGQWVLFAAPLTLLLQIVLWLYFWGWIMKFASGRVIDPDLIRRERAALGPVSREEWVVLVVGLSTALLWTFRGDIIIPEIGLNLPGWSGLIGFGKQIDDGTVAIGAALLLFFLPARKSEKGPRRLLDASAFREIPWGVILLFGGGFALAKGFETSGLTSYLSGLFTVLGQVPDWVLVLIICLSVTFLSELTSNTALIQVVLPVFAALATARGLPPMLVMFPAALAASCGFMLPAATPPNAIIFGSERVKISEMVSAGFVLDLVAAVCITGFVILFGPIIFGF